MQARKMAATRKISGIIWETRGGAFPPQKLFHSVLGPPPISANTMTNTIQLQFGLDHSAAVLIVLFFLATGLGMTIYFFRQEIAKGFLMILDLAFIALFFMATLISYGVKEAEKVWRRINGKR